VESYHLYSSKFKLDDVHIRDACLLLDGPFLYDHKTDAGGMLCFILFLNYMYLRKHISNIKNKISFLVRFSEIGLLLLLSDIIIRSKKQVKHNTPSANKMKSFFFLNTNIKQFLIS
jgi:hypothetical protein